MNADESRARSNEASGERMQEDESEWRKTKCRIIDEEADSFHLLISLNDRRWQRASTAKSSLNFPVE